MASKNKIQSDLEDSQAKLESDSTQLAHRSTGTGDKQLTAPGHYDADLGAGFEDMTMEDFTVPFISILQKMSPQVDPDAGAYIPDARPGMLFNTVTHQLFDGKAGILFIPCHRVHQFLEFIPRDQGGGFVKSWSPEAPEVIELRKGGAFGKLTIGDGNDLIETFSVWGLHLRSEEAYDQVIISFTSSQIKHYKRWMTTARTITKRGPDGHTAPYPLFAHRYCLATRMQENKKGSWHGWNISLDGPDAASCRLDSDGALYQAAKAFRDLAVSGVAKAATESVTQDDGTGTDDQF